MHGWNKHISLDKDLIGLPYQKRIFEINFKYENAKANQPKTCYQSPTFQVGSFFFFLIETSTASTQISPTLKMSPQGKPICTYEIFIDNTVTGSEEGQHVWDKVPLFVVETFPVSHVFGEIYFLYRPEWSLCFLVHHPDILELDGEDDESPGVLS